MRSDAPHAHHNLPLIRARSVGWNPFYKNEKRSAVHARMLLSTTGDAHCRRCTSSIRSRLTSMGPSCACLCLAICAQRPIFRPLVRGRPARMYARLTRGGRGVDRSHPRRHCTGGRAAGPARGTGARGRSVLYFALMESLIVWLWLCAIMHGRSCSTHTCRPARLP